MKTRTERRPVRTVLIVFLTVLLVAPAALRAQQADRQALGGGVQFHGYNFGEGLGADAASLLLVPVAYHVPVTDNLRADVYASWASGRVERDGRAMTLEGFTDTQIRAEYGPAPWALVTLSVNLPTGNTTHDSNESIVASVLATDLLSFREANWGTGFGITPGVATARQIGSWNVGLGASYRVSGGFEPEAGRSLTYEPGNEARVRLGVDRNVGEGGKVTAGVTLQNFDTDQLGGRNLFEAGNRFRVDASYAFRTGGSTWTVYGVNAWRDQGSLTLDLVDQQGAQVGDTLVHTSSQNLAQVGVAGSIPLGSTYRLRPMIDLQVQNREGSGSGWILGAGGDFPVRLFGEMDLFPRAKILYGQLDGANREGIGVWGGELGGSLRWRP